MLEPSLPEALICCSPEMINEYLRPLLYHFGGGSPRTGKTVESSICTAVFSICKVLKLTCEREKIEAKLLLCLVRDTQQASGGEGLEFDSLEIPFMGSRTTHFSEDGLDIY